MPQVNLKFKKKKHTIYYSLNTSVFFRKKSLAGNIYLAMSDTNEMTSEKGQLLAGAVRMMAVIKLVPPPSKLQSKFLPLSVLLV